MLKPIFIFNRKFHIIYRRAFSISNILLDHLKRPNSWDHEFIRETLLKAQPDQKIRLTAKPLYNYLNSSPDSIDKATKMKLIEIMCLQVTNSDDFRRFVNFMFGINEAEIIPSVYRLFKLGFLKHLEKLDAELTFKIIKHFKKMTSNLRINELRQIFYLQLRKLEKKEIFNEFLKSRYMTNSIFYGIVKSENDTLLTQNKEELFALIVDSGVVLSPKFEAVFEKEIAKQKMNKQIVDSLDFKVLSELSTDKSESFFLSQSFLQLLHWKLRYRENEDFVSLKISFEKVLEQKRILERNNFNEVFDILSYDFLLGNQKAVLMTSTSICYFISDLKESLFEEATTQWMFENHIYVIKKLVDAFQRVKNYPLVKKEQKEVTNLIFDACAEFIEKLALEQDLKKAFVDMEDLSFKDKSLGETKYRIKNFDFNNETIDCILFIFEKVVEGNFGSSRLLKALGVLTSDLIPQMSIEQFNQAIWCFSDSNFMIEEGLNQIEDYVDNRLSVESHPTAISDNISLGLGVVYYYTLVGKFDDSLFSRVSTCFSKNYKKVDELSLKQKSILALIKQIYRTSPQEFFQKVVVSLPEDFLVLPQSKFSDYFDKFFFFLFYKDVQKNQAVGFVNVHYSQNEFALILADWSNMTLDTQSAKGIVMLAKKYVETIYKEVGLLKIETTSKLDKQNDEMQELRILTKKWKVDFEFREKYYEKYAEGVSPAFKQEEKI